MTLCFSVEVLPSSICGHRKKRNKTAKIKAKPHKKSYQPLKDLCVGGKWFRIGSFRFWQRESCADRRYLAVELTASFISIVRVVKSIF